MTKSPDTSGSVDHPPVEGSDTDPAFAAAAAADDPVDGESGAGTNGELELEVEVEPPDPPEPTFEQRLAELEQKQKDTYDRYIRSVAELDNVRKRTRKDVEDARVEAQSRVLREMLPVIDNLERALAAAGGAEADSGHSIIEGVRLVLRQFAQALERCGVTPVQARGTAFDPSQHEAVSQVETPGQAPGTVVDVLQTGYRIGERLLRPALVVVAKAPVGGGAGATGGGNGHADGSDGGAESSGPNGHDPDAA